MSYDFVVAAPAAPGWRALRDAIGLDDVRIIPDAPRDDGWPRDGLRICRVGRSVRTTEVNWRTTEVDGKTGALTIVLRALPSRDDCDLALRVTEAAARLAGTATIHADYFGDIAIEELRSLHTADWMHEQAVSGARILATLIREGRGPMDMPGPNRSCYVGARLLAELEAAGPPDRLSDRVLEVMRRVQWGVPPGFRDAGLFVSGGKEGGAGARKTHFAIWLPDENLVLPRVDYVALRITEGDVVMVPFAAVAGLAGSHGTLIDECQLLLHAMNEDAWKDVIARARPLAVSPRK